jgi:uncharacterized protein YndB with AHSA1/START domain
MAHAIKHLFHINAPREQVYESLTTVDGLAKWWTVETTGNAGEGGTIQFRFGGQGPDMKVASLTPNEAVNWECIGLESPQSWVGNTVSFLLDDNDGKTRVHFSHEGWQEVDDFYANCNFSWARYLESLRQYCQTGNGEGFGQPGYRK